MPHECGTLNHARVLKLQAVSVRAISKRQWLIRR